MNVNDSKYHLFMGEADWGQCFQTTTDGVSSLAKIWEDNDPVDAQEAPPEWDADQSTIAIARSLELVAGSEDDSRFGTLDRRGRAADRNDNIYFVSTDRGSILVQSAGQNGVGTYWPDARSNGNKPLSTFDDARPLDVQEEYRSLTAICSDYLCAAKVDAKGSGLLRFDLVGGGAPEEFRYPSIENFDVSEIAAKKCGGLWLLDGNQNRLFALTPDMHLCAEEATEQQPNLFQSDDGMPQLGKETYEPWALDLGILTEPIELAEFVPDMLIVLDRTSDETASLYLIDCSQNIVTKLADLDFGALGFGIETVPNQTEQFIIKLWDASGNQARALRLSRSNSSWKIKSSADLIPMRRFGGQGLVLTSTGLQYPSETDPLSWIPLIVQKRCKFYEEAIFLTPPLDSDIFQCTWDRIRLDASIPPGSEIRFEARAFDRVEEFEIDFDNGWRKQPKPYPNRDGGELPALSLSAEFSGSKDVRACWDLALQDVIGRFVQLRVVMSGDARRSPKISAMRIWFPRFSYATKFLPELYTEDPVSGDFTERFLSNMEGVNTVIEGKIAAAQMMLDPRTASAATLDWLGDWFDVALDPAWDERRRRLFIKYATRFFEWRGTISGLQLALTLAFDPNIDDCDFALPMKRKNQSMNIRILENYRTRQVGYQHSQQSGSGSATPLVNVADGRWHISEGKAGLVQRWIEHSGQMEIATEQHLSAFSLSVNDYVSEDWSNFILHHLGFVPSVGAEERQHWLDFQAAIGVENPGQYQPESDSQTEIWKQFISLSSHNRQVWHKYLSRRYRHIEKLNQQWNEDWDDFDAIPVPDILPEGPAKLYDWLVFEGQIIPRQRSAHRFSVLLPRAGTAFDPAKEERDLALAKRIIALEKPAHTIFDVRFFWAMNRIGEARLGHDTQIGEGSRSPQLVPPSILGRNYFGSTFAGGPRSTKAGRKRLAC